MAESATLSVLRRRDTALGRATVTIPDTRPASTDVTTSASAETLAARAARLADREQARLRSATPGSGAMYERARRTMTLGVPSSYQARDPWPIYLTHGRGSRVWDVDGTEYSDFHNAFGSMV